MHKSILLIDDEAVPDSVEPDGAYMWYYTEALRQSGFDVKEAWRVETALELLADLSKKYALVILDIMMPAGELLDSPESEGGLRTGLVLADKVSELRPNTPILVLTNVAAPKTAQAIREKPNVQKVLFKPDWPPYDLADEVRHILEE